MASLGRPEVAANGASYMVKNDVAVNSDNGAAECLKGEIGSLHRA